MDHIERKTIIVSTGAHRVVHAKRALRQPSRGGPAGHLAAVTVPPVARASCSKAPRWAADRDRRLYTVRRTSGARAPSSQRGGGTALGAAL